MKHFATKAFGAPVATLGMLTTVTSGAVKELHHCIHQVDFAEFCCSPTSGLAAGMEGKGWLTKRFSHFAGHGFSVSSQASKALQEVSELKPKKGWFSTPLPVLQPFASGEPADTPANSQVAKESTSS